MLAAATTSAMLHVGAWLTNVAAVIGFLGALITIALGADRVRRRQSRNPPIEPKVTDDALRTASERFRRGNETDIAYLKSSRPPDFITGIRWRISGPHNPATELAPTNANEVAETLQALLDRHGAVELHGVPGAGKTHAIGQLAEQLFLAGREFAFVVASAWDPTTDPSFVEWMQHYVSERYRIAPNLVSHLLGSGQLVLLLDDLEPHDAKTYQRLIRDVSAARKTFAVLKVCYTCRTWQHEGLIASMGIGTTVELIELDTAACQQHFLRLGASPEEATSLAQSELLRSPLLLSLIASGELDLAALLRAVELGENEVLLMAWHPLISRAAELSTKCTESDIINGLRWIGGVFDRGLVVGPVLELERLTPEWLPDEKSRRRARRLLILWFFPGLVGFELVFAAVAHSKWWQLLIIALGSYAVGAVAYFFGHDLTIGPGRQIPQLVARRRLHWPGESGLSFLRRCVLKAAVGACLGALIGGVVGSVGHRLNPNGSLAYYVVACSLILIALFAVGRLTGWLISAMIAASIFGMLPNTVTALTVGALVGATMNVVISVFDTLGTSEPPEVGVTSPSQALWRSWVHNGMFEALKWTCTGLAIGLVTWAIEGGDWLKYGLLLGVAGVYVYALFWAAVPTFFYRSCSRILRRTGTVPLPIGDLLEVLVASRLMTRAGGGFGYRFLHSELNTYLAERPVRKPGSRAA